MTGEITVTITTPSDREAVVTRDFNAPASLVFDAVTKADLIKRWYGPAGSLDSCESDPRVGGSWRFAFTAGGPINIRNARFAEDREPIETGCPCPTCTGYSRAYVHHLVRSGEILGAMLMTEHNLWFYQRLMQGLRDAIAAQRFDAHAASFLDRYRG